MTMTATYSPEDNKLRLYSETRLDADLYARVKAFKDMATTWEELPGDTFSGTNVSTVLFTIALP